MVDATWIEPVTPACKAEPGNTLTALSGVAYTETNRIFALSNVPKLSGVGRVWKQVGKSAQDEVRSGSLDSIRQVHSLI